MTSRRIPRSGLMPQQRFIARSIMASTHRLAEQMLAEDWGLVPETLKDRRKLLGTLHDARGGGADAASCVAALHSAVAESERLIADIMPATRKIPAAN